MIDHTQVGRLISMFMLSGNHDIITFTCDTWISLYNVLKYLHTEPWSWSLKDSKFYFTHLENMCNLGPHGKIGRNFGFGFCFCCYGTGITESYSMIHRLKQVCNLFHSQNRHSLQSTFRGLAKITIIVTLRICFVNQLHGIHEFNVR